MARKFVLLDDEEPSLPLPEIGPPGETPASPSSGKFVLLDDEPEGAEAVEATPRTTAAPQGPHDAPSTGPSVLDAEPNADLEGKTPQQFRDDETVWPVEKDPVSTWNAFRSGFASDPGTQIRHFAANRFPDEPIEKATARYRLGKDGDIVFRGDDGRTYAELDPLAKVAQGVGEWVPAIGGAVVGGIAGGPLGAAAGGAAGEGLRKTVATTVLDEPREPVADAIDIGLAGVTEGIGWKAAEVPTRYLNRRTARDIDLLTPAQRAEAERLVQVGANEGIHVTPAEATNLPSLRGQQTYLGNTHGPAGDKVGGMYTDRNADIDAAVERHLPQAPHLTTAGAEAKPVFDAELERVYKERTAKATPAYQKVVHPGSLISPSGFQPIQANPFLAEQIAAIKSSTLHNDLAAMPENSLPVLDAVKKVIDGKIREAELKPELRHTVSALKRHKSDLLKVTDAEFPDYPKARAGHVEATPEVKDAERSIEGVIARLPEGSLSQTANEIFSATKNTAGPVQVARGRALFEREGKTAEWDNLLNAWLRKEWEGIPDRRVNPASSFHDRIYGSETKRNILKGGMGDDRYRSFNDLMSVLEATTRVQRGQSITHFAGEAAKETGRKAAPIVSLATDAANPTNLVLGKWWINRKSGKYNETLADIITNPDAMAKLKELRKLDPRSEKAISIVASVIAGLGREVGQDNLGPQLGLEEEIGGVRRDLGLSPPTPAPGAGSTLAASR